VFRYPCRLLSLRRAKITYKELELTQLRHSGSESHVLPAVIALVLVDLHLRTVFPRVARKNGTHATKGVTDRFRSLPISAAAVVLGRCIADMLNSIVGLAILVVAGLLLGWRWHAGLNAALAAIGLLLLLRFALLWMGIFVGLIAKGPESVTTVQILVWPISFLSNVFVDPSTMPAWLGMIAQWNPLSATASATRALFMNPGWQGSSWIAENAVLMAIVWPAWLTAIFLPLTVRKYRRLSR
jgi:ABC-2 type transport system permease protein